MKKFRLPRKTKKQFQYFRNYALNKKYWKQYCRKGKYGRSWNKHKKNYSYMYYSYTQDEWSTFKKDKARNFICSWCGDNIFEHHEYPEHHKEYGDLMCEGCYDNEFRDTCPICEESYEKSEVEGDLFPKSPFYWFNSSKKEDWEDDYHEYHPSGIYQAKQYPVFTAATGGLGSTYIEWRNLEFICSIEDFIKEEYGDRGWREYDEWINDDYKDDKAEFIGDCCWGAALKIRDSKLRKEVNP